MSWGILRESKVQKWFLYSLAIVRWKKEQPSTTKWWVIGVCIIFNAPVYIVDTVKPLILWSIHFNAQMTQRFMAACLLLLPHCKLKYTVMTSYRLIARILISQSAIKLVRLAHPHTHIQIDKPTKAKTVMQDYGGFRCRLDRAHTRQSTSIFIYWKISITILGFASGRRLCYIGESSAMAGPRSDHTCIGSS